MHPHAAQWAMVRGMVADGIEFWRERMQQGVAAGGGAVGRAAREQVTKTGKDAKVKRKEKKKAKKGDGSVGGDALLAAEVATEVVGSAGRDPSSKETQAGGGGKWVHVPG